MKIGRDRIIIKALSGRDCPECGEKLERISRLMWQKSVSFVLPFRHYRCTGCYHEFFALSPSWRKSPLYERVFRVLFTVAVAAVVIFVFFKILVVIFSSIFR